MNLHEALKVVKELVETDTIMPYRGICAALDYRGVRVYTSSYPSTNADTFLALCKKWPKYSGSEGYPVPSTDPKMSACSAFYDAMDRDVMWVGEYGALRMELLDFLIKETQP